MIPLKLTLNSCQHNRKFKILSNFHQHCPCSKLEWWGKCNHMVWLLEGSEYFFFNLVFFFLIAALTAKNVNKLPFCLQNISQLKSLEFFPYWKILTGCHKEMLKAGSQQDCSNSFVPVSQNIKMMLRALLSQIVCLWIAGQNSPFYDNPEMRSWTLPLTAIPTLLAAAGVCCSDRVWAGWAQEGMWEIFAAPQTLTVPQECWASPSIIKDKMSLWTEAQNSLEGLYQVGFPQGLAQPQQVQHHHDGIFVLPTAFTAVTPSVLMLGVQTSADCSKCLLHHSTLPSHLQLLKCHIYIYYIYTYTFQYVDSQALQQAAQGNAGVPMPGGIDNLCGCGTWAHGLMVGLAVLWQCLDLLILKVFSQPKWFCEYIKYIYYIVLHFPLYCTHLKTNKERLCAARLDPWDTSHP